MLYIFLSLLILIPSFIGWGKLLKKWLFPNFENNSQALGDDGIFGFIAMGFIGTLFNFFIPLYSNFCLVITILGLLFFIRWTTLLSLRKPICLSFFLLFTASIFYAFRSPHTYDTGLYHLPMTLWHHLSQLPVGLGHVHNRFAGNHIWFNIAAMLWLPYLELAAVFSIPVILLFFLLLSLVEYLCSQSQTDSLHTPSKLFALSALIIFMGITQVGYSIMGALRSLSTDVPSALIALYATLQSIRLMEYKKIKSLEDQKQIFDVLLVLCAFSITIKISAVPLLLLLIPSLSLLTLNRTFYFLTIFSGIWILKGFLMSGCLAWPVAFTCFESVSWGLGPLNAKWNIGLVQAWGRSIPVLNATPPIFNRWDWITAWIPHTLSMPFINFILKSWIISLGLLIFCFLKKTTSSTKTIFTEHKNWTWIISVQCIGIVFWFLSAPDFRFGYSSLLGLTILLLASALYSFSGKKRFMQNLPYGAVLICTIYFLNAYRIVRTESLDGLKNPWPDLPAVKTSKNENKQGIKFNFPESGDQCWNTQIPCTPKQNNNLMVTRRLGLLMFTQEHKDFKGVL